jgi:twinkle protein
MHELQITEGKEFMPQTGKTENAIHFNYFIGDQLINIKYRDGRKNFS